MNTHGREQSPFERRAYYYIEQGYSVIPIAPGTKRPGTWSAADGWRGMHDWERFGSRLPTELELEHWYRWPGAGIGLVTGKMSGVIGLDRDYDTDGTDALDKLIPYTPVKKKGAKGYTAFFRYNGERSCSFNIGGVRVLDVLSDGRQTLMPGTIHPDGHAYVWLTEDVLEEIKPKDLPALPDDFIQRVEVVLAPYQTDTDRKYQRKTLAMPDNSGEISLDLSEQARYFRDLNVHALKQLDRWVKLLIPGARPERDGYRCVATWRGCKNPNVGIHPSGVFDFGGNYGMTPIDLVMYANGLTFARAAEALREHVRMKEPEPILLTVGGATTMLPQRAIESGAAAAPMVMPWQMPVTRIEPPDPIMLPSATSFEPAPAIPTFIANPPGMLGVIARWITATAPKSQPELSVSAAIALGSVVMGRTYRSQFGNFTSLYMIMVAKSTEGKEHPQSCVEKVLALAGLSNLLGGSGYTSPGAVFSALLKSPSHLVVIDELGKLLKYSRAKGNSHSEAAIDKLVEAFGRLDGIMRPPSYSSMSEKQRSKAADAPIVQNPAITLLGATTPATFYGALTSDLVHDGFLGRCIIVESKQPRQLTRFVERTDPPEEIVEWCKEVHVSGQLDGDLAGVMIPDMPATIIELPFSESCMAILQRLEEQLNRQKEASEIDELDVLLGRTQEKAMRLAMIVAKAENPRAQEVLPHHLEWAVEYVMYYDSAMVRSVRLHKVEGEIDADIQRAIRFIEGAPKYAKDPRWGKVMKQGAMPHSALLKRMKCSARHLREVIETALESQLIFKTPLSAFGEFGVGDAYVLRPDEVEEE